LQKSKSPGALAFAKLIKNKPAVFGLGVILLSILVAVLGANIRKDKTLMANEMLLPIAAQKPGFKVSMLKINKGKAIESANFFEQMFFGGKENPYQYIPISKYRLEGDELYYNEYSGEGEAFLPELNIKMVQVAFGINVSEFDSNSQLISFINVNGQKQSISQQALKELIQKNNISTEKYVLGTDKYGRDLLSRIFAGTIISLSVGLIAVFISLLVGIFMGAIAGYYGGKTDAIITWFINVIWSIPTLLLVISITLLLGKGFSQIFIAVGLTMWVEVARITRGQFLSLREKEFVEAARALGYKPFRIIFKHILPNAWSPLIVISASNFANAILIEAGLSFLGVGAQPPMPSWGNMIKEHYGYIVLDKAYLALAPGCAIMLLVLAFTLLGNGLRDALDTRSVN
jgi:ABC-type dipeptide/oligopeptide/nickel transport system permease subunit